MLRACRPLFGPPFVSLHSSSKRWDACLGYTELRLPCATSDGGKESGSPLHTVVAVQFSSDGAVRVTTFASLRYIDVTVLQTSDPIVVKVNVFGLFVPLEGIRSS